MNAKASLSLRLCSILFILFCFSLNAPKLHAQCIINPIADQILCTDNQTQPVIFASDCSNPVYNWTNSNPSIGLPASGSGNIASFTAINNGTSPVTATITVVEGLVSETINFTGSIVTWTVPPGITSIRMEARGAQGGSVTVSCSNPGGLGASMAGDFAVTPGEVLTFLVGGQGLSNGSDAGGGGGTYVVRNLNIPMLVAGGGGGATNNIGNCGSNLAGIGGQTSTAGTSSANGIIAGGINGNGGGASGGSGGGGGGFFTDGQAGQGLANNNGKSFLNGGIGGTGNNNDSGGFGGGGAGWFTGGNGGGGGGYSGGGTSGNQPFSGGGGGGSYNIGTNQTNTGSMNAGNGMLILTYGSGTSFDITVNPTPTIDEINDKVYCPDVQTNEIVFTGSNPGLAYSWTNDNTSIGLSGSGTGNIPSFTTTNSGTTPLVANITVTPMSVGGEEDVLTYNYTGDVQTFTVPEGVTSVNIVAKGASGGTAPIGGTGGLGGVASGTLTVTPGQVLNIYVGGQNGYNGGGNGGLNGNDQIGTQSTGMAPNGGGASDVRTGGISLTDRVIVAGGGGGAGANGVWPGCQVAGPAGNGGSGGGLNALNGGFGVGIPCNCEGGGGNGGFGGTQSLGGIAGGYFGSTACLRPNWTIGSNGSLGFGGNGSLTFYNGTGGGGGGGGGYFGGGSGGSGSDTTPGGGGGGGSSYIGGVTNGSTQAGSQNGDGEIIISYISAVGCPGEPETFTITVNPDPVYTLSVNGNVYEDGDTIVACNQDVLAISVTATAGSTYSFKRLSNNNVISSGSTPGAFNYTANNAREGYYEISITANGGCIAIDTVYLLVNPLPNPTATATPNPICAGQNLQLGVNGNNNFTFAWSGPGGYSSNVKNPLITNIQTSGSGTYTVTVTNLNGCSNTSSISVVVNPLPTAVATPASQNICTGSTITTIVLSGSVQGATYNWTRDNTATVTGIAATGSGNIAGSLTNTTNAPVVVTFTITPTTSVCGGVPVTATITVNPIPTVIASPSSQTVCSGGAISTIAFSGAVTGTTYNWTRDNTATVTGIAASGSGNISGTLTNTTLAPVTVTFTITPTASGCAGSPTTATVIVNPTPQLTATPATQTICSGAPIMTIFPGGGVPGSIYTWTRDNTVPVTGIAASGTGVVNGILTNNTASPLTVTFTFTASSNGCAATPVTATVIVNPKPVGTISIVPNPACVGSTVQLSATGGTTYSWSGPQGWTSNVQNPTILIVNHLQAGKYKVTITNGSGCSVVLDAVLNVYYPPVAVATYDVSTACKGSDLQLYGSGAGSYTWTGPNGFTSTVQNPVINDVSDVNSGIYVLTVTSPNGCTATSTLNITINTPPQLSANPTLTQTCEGSTVQLSASGSGAFSWSGPAGWLSTVQNPVINNIPLYMSGIFTVTLTGNTGCTNTASVEVQVSAYINATISATPNPVCEGQSLQLHADGGSSYLWNGPAGFNSTEQNPRIDNITEAHEGKYYVYVTNEGGCYGYAEMKVEVLPVTKASAYAAPNPVNEFSSVQFFASDGLSYQWSGPLGFTSTEQTPVIKKVTRYMAGIYTVTITNENGCPSVVKVNLRVLFTNKGGTIAGGEEGLSTRTEQKGSVYPNPTNNFLYFETESRSPIEYMIYDVSGKIQTQQLTTPDNYIRTEQLSSGIYQIRWKPQDQSDWIVSKFVKIR